MDVKRFCGDDVAISVGVIKDSGCKDNNIIAIQLIFNHRSYTINTCYSGDCDVELNIFVLRNGPLHLHYTQLKTLQVVATVLQADGHKVNCNVPIDFEACHAKNYSYQLLIAQRESGLLGRVSIQEKLPEDSFASIYHVMAGLGNPDEVDLGVWQREREQLVSTYCHKDPKILKTIYDEGVVTDHFSVNNYDIHHAAMCVVHECLTHSSWFKTIQDHLEQRQYFDAIYLIQKLVDQAQQDQYIALVRKLITDREGKLISLLLTQIDDPVHTQLQEEYLQAFGRPVAPQQEQTGKRWLSRICTPAMERAKMEKNLEKARAARSDDEWVVTDVQLEARLAKLPKQAHRITPFFRMAQGLRQSMEDKHLVNEVQGGGLLAIFDGHAGKGAAELAKEKFSGIFRTYLRSGSSIFRALELTCIDLHEQVLTKTKSGCTSVICYIRDGWVYTATIGDSEAFLATEEGLIPLSVVRDWGSPKEEQRAKEVLKIPDDQEWYPSSWTGKSRRFPGPKGANFSRSIGDPSYTYSNGSGAVIHKPKISRCPVHPGDRLILGCDGLVDFVLLSNIQISARTMIPPDAAQELVACSLAEQSTRRNDNVTVCVAAIE